MKLVFLLLGFLILLSNTVTSTAQDVAAQKKPLKVFILVGQSNMQGHARIHTLEHVGTREDTKSIYEMLTTPDGSPKVHKDVWINSLSSETVRKGNLTVGFGADETKIGPELAFGVTMQQLIGEPILIVKTSWGGKSLHTDFRPPGAGDYVFSDQEIQRIEKQKKNLQEIRAQKKEATGHHYRLMLEHVREVLGDIKSTYPNYDAELGFELAGMVWFQGWNDMVDSGVYPNRGEDGGYDKYCELLVQFIKDVRQDLEAPKLPFVIGVMGVGGPTAEYSKREKRHQKVHQNFRDAMAGPTKLPEFKDNVAAVLTENYWDLHLADLRARQRAIGDEVKKARKEKELDRDAERRLKEKLLIAEFTKQEQLELEKGVSNFAFHYLGSATILTQVGKGFAEAMHELVEATH